MLDIKDLWIGDLLLLKKSGRKGIYKGITSAGKLRIEIGGKIILTSKNNVEILEDDEELQAFTEFEEEADTSLTTEQIRFNDTIDLHIDKLAPFLINELPLRIVDFQIRKCKEFIEYAIGSNRKIIKIIHGKGDGTLKSEVHHLLDHYDEVNLKIPVNDGGATEVWLK